MDNIWKLWFSNKKINILSNDDSKSSIGSPVNGLESDSSIVLDNKKYTNQKKKNAKKACPQYTRAVLNKTHYHRYFQAFVCQPDVVVNDNFSIQKRADKHGMVIKLDRVQKFSVNVFNNYTTTITRFSQHVSGLRRTRCLRVYIFDLKITLWRHPWRWQVTNVHVLARANACGSYVS